MQYIFIFYYGLHGTATNVIRSKMSFTSFLFSIFYGVVGLWLFTPYTGVKGVECEGYGTLANVNFLFSKYIRERERERERGIVSPEFMEIQVIVLLLFN